MNEKVKEIQKLANNLESLDKYYRILTRWYTKYSLKIVRHNIFSAIDEPYLPDNAEGINFIKDILDKHFNEILEEISEEINNLERKLEDK